MSSPVSEPTVPASAAPTIVHVTARDAGFDWGDAGIGVDATGEEAATGGASESIDRSTLGGGGGDGGGDVVEDTGEGRRRT